MQKNIIRRPFLHRANSRHAKPRVCVPNRKRSVYSAHNQLRLVPLSDEIKREMTTDPDSGSNEERKCPGSGTGSDSIHVECFVELIRMEIRKYIEEMNLNEVFVKKTDLPSLCDLIVKTSSTSTSKSMLNDSGEKEGCTIDCSTGSDDLAKKQADALRELENAFLSDQESNYKIASKDQAIIKSDESEKHRGKRDNVLFDKKQDETMKSVHIMFSVNNARKDSDISNSEENSNPECGVSHLQQSTIRSLESRLSVLEMQLNAIYKILQRIKFLTKDTKSSKSGSKLVGSKHLEKKHRIELDIGAHHDKEIEAIEADVKRIIQKNTAQFSFLSEDKINPYDDLYYEWRQNKMNLLHYKKSLRSIHLNQHPKINQFIGPPIKKVSGSKLNIKKRPAFVLTPSRMKNNV